MALRTENPPHTSAPDVLVPAPSPRARGRSRIVSLTRGRSRLRRGSGRADREGTSDAKLTELNDLSGSLRRLLNRMGRSEGPGPGSLARLEADYQARSDWRPLMRGEPGYGRVSKYVVSGFRNPPHPDRVTSPRHALLTSVGTLSTDMAQADCGDHLTRLSSATSTRSATSRRVTTWISNHGIVGNLSHGRIRRFSSPLTGP